MGISGLLPFLKEASTNGNIKEFAGQTVAVDTYCWIYRGAFSCAEELALDKPTDGHVRYVLRYVNRLLEWNIKPVMIFDGSCLPSKKGTELKRRESKDLYRKKAAQCLKEGKVNEARECFQRCIECTPKMALQVIQALHKIGVDVLVAPYEADAQLAYLNKINVAQVIITEDSDLILFGCNKVFYKMDMNGNGQLINKEKIISITQFDSADNFERFRWMCILSGCDYLENLPGIGLGKAKKFLKSIKKTDIDEVLKQMPKILKMPNLPITSEYIEQFKRADNTFKYQIVFDPLKRKLVPSNPYQIDPEVIDLSYAGLYYDDELALQHSLGNIDVNTREIVYNFNPDKWNYKPPNKFSKTIPGHMKSIWAKDYAPYDSQPLKTMFNRQFEQQNIPKTVNMIKTHSAVSSTWYVKRKADGTVESSHSECMKREEKKLRIDAESSNIKEIDNILKEYNRNTSEPALHSHYFRDKGPSSPILSNKSSQNSIMSTNPSQKMLPSSPVKTQESEDHQRNSFNSPILVKSKFFKVVREETNDVSQSSVDKINSLIEQAKVNEFARQNVNKFKANDENKEYENVEEERGKLSETIVQDIEQIGVKNKENILTPQSSSSLKVLNPNSSKIKSKSSKQDPKDQPSITSFFANQYKYAKKGFQLASPS